MATTMQIAEIAGLVGDPTRAAMLGALMDGRALTATELAAAAGVTPATASSHLGRLTLVGLVAVTQQGRHRYHRLASADVARMLEGIMQLASGLARPARKIVVGPRDAALRAGRTCYDHLAGRLGVGLADALVAGGQVELGGDGGVVTARGMALFDSLGFETGRTMACRPCLDWSERRPHLAGRLGAALCAHCLTQGWVRKMAGTRAVEVTVLGRGRLRDVFGLRDTN